MTTRDVVIVSMARTPLGSFQGSLASVSAPQLGATAIQAALKRAQLTGDQVQEVILGNVLQAGVGQAPARQALLGAGIPNSVPAVTINKVCGSGMKAILQGTQSILVGDNDIVVAGGMENMSQVPHYLMGSRNGFRLGNTQLTDGLIWDGLWDPYDQQHMGNCAELCAREWKFSREEQDAYATESFKRAQEAQKSGKFISEIAPVSIKGPKGDVALVAEDEGPSKVKFEKIPQLKPVFDKAGTVTAANASTINDGAAALVLMSRAKAQALGLKPLGRIAGWGANAQEPKWFTTAPAVAMKRALEKAQWKSDSVDLFEVNEAFAVVALAAQRELKIAGDQLNVWGGAISLGHPIGASGARIVVTLLSALQDRGLKRGLAGICIGGGEALSIAVEREDA